jgi:RNA polymerase-binding transcription factor DksA
MITDTTIRPVLEAKIMALDEELAELQFEPDPDRLGETGDALDGMREADADREARLGTYELLQLVRAEVVAAIAKLDAGTYGICDDCGELIAPNRLTALPYALQCVDCAGRERPSTD